MTTIESIKPLIDEAAEMLGVKVLSIVESPENTEYNHDFIVTYWHTVGRKPYARRVYNLNFGHKHDVESIRDKMLDGLMGRP